MTHHDPNKKWEPITDPQICANLSQAARDADKRQCPEFHTLDNGWKFRCRLERNHIGRCDFTGWEACPK